MDLITEYEALNPHKDQEEKRTLIKSEKLETVKQRKERIEDFREAAGMDGLTTESLRRRNKGKYEAFPLQPVLRDIESVFGPPEEGEVGNGESQRIVALEGDARGHSEGDRSGEAQQPRSLGGFAGLGEVYAAEHRRVLQAAEEGGFSGDLQEYTRRWREGGSLGGAEHHVYFDTESGRVHKRNRVNRPNGSVRDSLERLALNNALFPSTAYRVESVMRGTNGSALLHVSQALIGGVANASAMEIEEMMRLRGFRRIPLALGRATETPGTYYHDGLGVLVYDMEPVNVLRSEDGALYPVDPMIAVVREGSWASFQLEKVGIKAKADRDWVRQSEFTEEPLLRSMASDMGNQRKWMRRELAARGLEPTPENVDKLAAQWRAFDPNDVDNPDVISNNQNSEKVDNFLFARSKGSASGQPVRVSGDRLQAAASHFGGSGGVRGLAGGKAGEKASLVEWARSEGILIDRLPNRIGGPRDKGQGEHHVFFNRVANRWLKITKGTGDRMGMSLNTDVSPWRAEFGSIEDYLINLQTRNEVTGDDTRLHAVYQDQHGNVGLVTSQPDIQGEIVDEAWLNSAMEKAGFEILIDGSVYYRPVDNLLWIDLHEANAVRGPNDALLIYDGTATHPTEQQRSALGVNFSSALKQ